MWRRPATRLLWFWSGTPPSTASQARQPLFYLHLSMRLLEPLGVLWYNLGCFSTFFTSLLGSTFLGPLSQLLLILPFSASKLVIFFFPMLLTCVGHLLLKIIYLLSFQLKFWKRIEPNVYIQSVILTRVPCFISSMGWFHLQPPGSLASFRLKDTLQPLRSYSEGRGEEFQLIKGKCSHLRRVEYFLW